MHYTQIVTELTTGYIALFLLTKVLGKTQITQITAFDFISAMILGELVGNALYDDHVGVLEVLFTVAFWGLLVYITEITTQKVQRFRGFLEGHPSIVIHKGQIVYKALKKNHLDLNQLQLLLRKKDIFSIRECEFAILETDGSVSVVKKPEYSTIITQDLNIVKNPSTLPVSVVLDGEIIRDNLQLIHKDEKWLHEQLRLLGKGRVKDVLFAEWMEGESLFVQGYESKSEGAS
ncbi:DUF421 domain-containing protein [Peribacillus alkalitolerans]|uniref:DUF421 domain-containing protein n=1 Tax=Peribacillus alkalitolerans TaxID=1550385 RepID=UPI0013D4F434|nr:DUF421 domain-containing protein [Peribacillus alkalitolerans]